MCINDDKSYLLLESRFISISLKITTGRIFQINILKSKIQFIHMHDLNLLIEKKRKLSF